MMEISWLSDRDFMAKWWRFHGPVMEISWQSDGDFMAKWWRFHGKVMDISVILAKWRNWGGNWMEMQWLRGVDTRTLAAGCRYPYIGWGVTIPVHWLRGVNTCTLAEGVSKPVHWLCCRDTFSASVMASYGRLSWLCNGNLVLKWWRYWSYM